jgi:hypothetical protein
MFIMPNNDDKRCYTNGSVTAAFDTKQLGGHVFAVSGTNAYLDGVLDASLNGGNLAGVALTLLAGNRNGIIDKDFQGSMQAFAIYNITITATRISDLTDAMNAL